MLNYDIHPLTNKLLDSLSSHCFLPHMLQPTRGASNSKVLTDDTFTNISVPNIIFGNITASIQTTFHSFLIFLSILLITVPINRKDTGHWSIKFCSWLFFGWTWQSLPTSNLKTDNSYKTFFEKPISLLHKYAPLKNPVKIN